MNENDLKLLWRATSEKMEGSLQVNKKNIDEITKLKIHSAIASMKPTKIFALIVGISWVIGLGSILIDLVVYHWEEVSLFFLFSASIQVSLTAITIGVYVYQIELINQIDFSTPVLSIQAKVIKLKISTLNVTRLLFLQLPAWTTFYWNEEMFTGENWLWWVLQGFVTLLLTSISLWLFLNIKYENRNKKWFRLIFSSKEWKPILQSMELLSQMEQYQA